MPKQFAKITQRYSTKNKLQELIFKEMEIVDFTLYPDFRTAKKEIVKLYEKALSDYKGKASIPELKIFDRIENVVRFDVDDVISISVFNTKYDWT
ncbi:hypothetical protein N4T20_02615 [Flavobacterium sp. TR2]|uniref:hypothetical protein n=1 Tax=Flavobacterium sp. TR2 TaxID=2977321 RepID=UPI0021B11AE3|nr:hypothetical protein [Flavobacterium sp. TR2]UWY28824.1 hypothetical protein N4T20_02615 [Flavobacterium sp. TR2]